MSEEMKYKEDIKRQILEVSSQLFYDKNDDMFSLDVYIHPNEHIPRELHGKIERMKFTPELIKAGLHKEVMDFIYSVYYHLSNCVDI